MRVRTPIAVTVAAVMTFSSLGLGAAAAAPAASLQKAVQLNAGNAEIIQVASKKKRHRGNNAAAAAAFAGIAGAMIGLAIQDSQRDRYYGGGYGYAPRYRNNGHHGYRGNRVYHGNRGYYGNGRTSAPVNRHGLLPNNLPVGNDPLNADPYGR